MDFNSIIKSNIRQQALNYCSDSYPIRFTLDNYKFDDEGYDRISKVHCNKCIVTDFLENNLDIKV